MDNHSNSVDLVIEPGRVKGRSLGGHEVTPTAGSGWCRPPPRTFGQLLSRPRTPQPAATATTGVRCRARRSNSCRAEIGSRYGVPAWRVKKRRKELGVHRPVGPPPRPALPNAPPADVLHRWYVDQGRALGQIARRQHTSSSRVPASTSAFLTQLWTVCVDLATTTPGQSTRQPLPSTSKPT